MWIFVYTVGIQLIVIVGHRKMYELKMKNGWLIEEQKKVLDKIHIYYLGSNKEKLFTTLRMSMAKSFYEKSFAAKTAEYLSRKFNIRTYLIEI